MVPLSIIWTLYNSNEFFGPVGLRTWEDWYTDVNLIFVGGWTGVGGLMWGFDEIWDEKILISANGRDTR